MTSEVPAEDLARIAAQEAAAHAYPEAQEPDRFRWVNAHGIRLAVSEWGDPDAPPLLLAHGGFDFSRTLDVFAPKLAAGGWRVVSWDQRGHGDSEHVALYSWAADVRDGLAVLDTVSRRPVAVVGHSKGGTLLMNLAVARPHRVSALVNIDGIPSGGGIPDVSDHERTEMLRTEIASWLTHRHRIDGSMRRPGTIEELAERRRQMNTRLSTEWLRYLVTVGARRDPDGWRWKIDRALRMGGFGPWRPQWSLNLLPSLSMPFLGLLAGQPDVLGWGTQPSDTDGYVPPWGRVELIEDAGHFIHIEQPDRVAAMVLEFLAVRR